MSVASLILSILALCFSALTFWWLNWRPSKLRIGTPPSYAGFGDQHKLLLECPFVFYNDGGRPVVVDNLRLRLPHEGGRPLLFNATVEKLGTDQGRAFATQFFVGPRQAARLICEFQRNPGELTFDPRDYKVVLEARLDGQSRWRPLLVFTL